MKKLYVIVSPDGRTPEQVAEIREQIRSDVEDGMLEDIQLVLPTQGLQGVTADVDAVLKADIVVSTQGSMYNKDCRICNFVASEYVSYGVYEEDWVTNLLEQRREERARNDIPDSEDRPQEEPEEEQDENSE